MATSSRTGKSSREGPPENKPAEKDTSAPSAPDGIPDGNPGDLDPTFGDGGRTTTANLGQAHGALLQPDGQIVVVGYTAEAYGKISLARYKADGSLDDNFGNGGAAIIEFGESAQAEAVALQTDGKIIVAGSAYPQGLAVTRLNVDGTLDPAFGQGGRVLTVIPDHESTYARAVAVLDDGRIVVGGRAGLDNQDSVLARYQTDGTLDAGFGPNGNGIVVTDFAGGFDEIFAICVEDDGKIVTVGRTASKDAALGDFGVARYTPDGVLDEHFGRGGKISVDFSQGTSFTEDCAYAAARLPNGQVIVAGTTGNDWSRDAALARLNADGSLDTTFGERGDGLIAHDFGTGWEKAGGMAQQFDEIYAVVVQADGRILIGGSTQPVVGDAETRDFLVARYTEDGRLDQTFGQSGVVTTDFGQYEEARALILQEDERIVAVGHTRVGDPASFALARYLNPNRAPAEQPPPPEPAPAEAPAEPPAAAPPASNGEAPAPAAAPTYLDRTFNEQGAVFASFGKDAGEARALRVQPDGAVIVVGSVGATDGKTPRDVAMVRVLPDGTLDEGFGTGGHAFVDIGGSDDVGHSVALQKDGKIVVAGAALDGGTNNLDFALIRLNSDGHVDKSFGGAGFVLTDFLGGTDDRAYAMAIQKDGKIVAAGYTTRPEEAPEPKKGNTRKSRSKSKASSGESLRTEYFALARYGEEGNLDQKFGENGFVMTPFEGDLARAEALALHSKGEIVAAGFARSSPDDHASDFAVVRYRTDGTLDESFGEDGIVLIDVEGTDNIAQAISIQPDGSIVLAGSAADQEASTVHFAVVRLDAHGKLDTTFNGTGIALATSFTGSAYGVAVESDGSILAAGYAEGADGDTFAVVRYRNDGSLDPAFGVDGVMLVGLGGVVDRASAISLDAEGKMLVAGTSRTVDKTEFALVRLLGASEHRG